MNTTEVAYNFEEEKSPPPISNLQRLYDEKQSVLFCKEVPQAWWSLRIRESDPI